MIKVQCHRILFRQTVSCPLLLLYSLQACNYSIYCRLDFTLLETYVLLMYSKAMCIMYSLIIPYPHRSSELYSEDFCIRVHPQFISFLLPFAFSIQLCTVYAQVFCILRSSVLPGPSKAKVICLQRTFVTF